MNDLYHMFMGVVEDTKDPLEVGRVRVRIIGQHSKDTVANDTTGKGMDTETLPWSQCMLPTTAGGVHGFKGHPQLMQGAWIFGVSLDGPVMNRLLILGSLPGIPEEENPNPKSPPAAFHGIDGLWPDAEFVGEPDYPREARGKLEFKNTKFKPLAKYREETKKTVEKAGGGSWAEPVPKAGAYLTNGVYKTPSGHIIELDDTPGNEHVCIGNGLTKTYMDMLPDGGMAVRVNGNSYKVTLKDENLSVEGALNITVKGATNILCNGKALIDAKDSVEVKAAKDVTVDAKGNAIVKAGSSVNVKAGGNAVVEAGGSLAVKGRTVSVQASGALTLGGSAGVTISGPTIKLAGKKI